MLQQQQQPAILFPGEALAQNATGFLLSALSDTSPDDGQRYQDQAKGQRDLLTQIVISVTLGLFAFLTFCIMRLKWASLYGARREVRESAKVLPDLDRSLFGWIPQVYRIDEDQILNSAGLDAYVFLCFYQFAKKLLLIIFFFAVVFILPVTYSYTGRYGYPWDGKPIDPPDDDDGDDEDELSPTKGAKADATYLWIYVIFAYVFTGLAIYLLVQFTERIIRRRQSYLGSQTTTVDRTFRLTGIPPDLRTTEKVKAFIEDLGIGKVENVNICRDWRELDEIMSERTKCLNALEKSWTEYVGFRPADARRKKQKKKLSLSARARAPSSISEVLARDSTTEAEDDDEETTGLLAAERTRGLPSPVPAPNQRKRPQVRIWTGPGVFKFLRSRKVDAISYYTEKLEELNDRVEEARAKEYPPMSLAFVTMESIASCQMAIQAILDPSPLQLKARIAPAPADVVWRNTYLTRLQRKLRSWSVTTVILILTLFWSALLVPLAYLLNLETLEKVIPQLATFLARHAVLKSLVQTGLPTLTLSLLSIAVPYLYDYLANRQGMTSQGDVELSVISKNFFFTFFNLFLLFTVFATASNFYGLWENLRDVFKDTTMVAFALARSLERLAPFYTNLIVLQGLGLHPFRLLEFGAVFLYPFQRLGAITPRDYMEIKKPPTFSYGLALPQAILIFVICVVYSVFPSSWLVCLFGVLYFFIGGFIYKYQLLYAMDHSQHSTGRAWPMICSRIIMGLIMFQLTTIGSLALRTAITRSILVLPLLFATVWFWYFFARTYDPLMKFIALRSIDRSRPPVSLSDTQSSPPSPTAAAAPAADGARSEAAEALAARASALDVDVASSSSEDDHDPLTDSATSFPPLRRSATSPASPPSGVERDTVPIRLGGRNYGEVLKKYVNPNLVSPLETPWIPGRPHSRFDLLYRPAEARRGEGGVHGQGLGRAQGGQGEEEGENPWSSAPALV